MLQRSKEITVMVLKRAPFVIFSLGVAYVLGWLATTVMKMQHQVQVLEQYVSATIMRSPSQKPKSPKPQTPSPPKEEVHDELKRQRPKSPERIVEVNSRKVIIDEYSDDEEDAGEVAQIHNETGAPSTTIKKNDEGEGDEEEEEVPP